MAVSLYYRCKLCDAEVKVAQDGYAETPPYKVLQSALEGGPDLPYLHICDPRRRGVLELVGAAPTLPSDLKGDRIKQTVIPYDDSPDPNADEDGA